MGNIINLVNNYYFVINDKIDEYATDITKLKLKEIRSKKCLILKVDFTTLEKKDYKKALRKLLRIKRLLKLYNIEIGLPQENSTKKIGYLINYDKNDNQQNDFILSINAILYNKRIERYNYIYDTVCDYLDGFFYGKNLCDFKDNKCGEKRNTSSTWGCCRHYKIKWLGPLTKWVLCEHLNEDYTCGAKCLGCKLYTCDYLRSKGVQFKIKDILLLDVFFNPLQKLLIKCMVFTPKEKIIKRLMIT